MVTEYSKQLAAHCNPDWPTAHIASKSDQSRAGESDRRAVSVKDGGKNRVYYTATDEAHKHSKMESIRRKYGVNRSRYPPVRLRGGRKEGTAQVKVLKRGNSSADSGAGRGHRAARVSANLNLRGE